MQEKSYYNQPKEIPNKMNDKKNDTTYTFTIFVLQRELGTARGCGGRLLVVVTLSLHHGFVRIFTDGRIVIIPRRMLVRTGRITLPGRDPHITPGRIKHDPKWLQMRGFAQGDHPTVQN